jgi:hypothetical protein
VWSSAWPTPTGAGRRLIGLQTDVRAAFIASKLNPMVKMALDYIAVTEEELLEYLKELSQGG